MQVSGHSLEELDTLRDEFDSLVRRALAFVATAVAQHHTTVALTAGIEEDSQAVFSAWAVQVDETLVPHIAAIYDGASLSVAHQLADGLPLGPDDGVPSVPPGPSIEYLRQARNRLVGVGDDIWERVRAELVAGVAAGESSEQLALRIHAATELALPRARTVARTEVNGASNAGAHAQVAFLGLSGTQEWLATEDGRTRQAHADADGQRVSLGQAFTVGGYTLHYPGDPAAPAGEIVNCRCTTAYDIADEPLTVTCSAQAALVAATSYAGVKHVNTGHCVVPPSATSTAVDTDKLSELSAGQKQYVYLTFQHPKKISPAYGGAKIHKQLQSTMDALSKSGKPELAALGPNEILHIVDQHYTGGKYTFKQKYDEWLGPKGVNTHVAQKVSEAEQTLKKVDEIIAESAKPTHAAPVMTPKPTHAESVSAPVKTSKGHVPLAQQSGNITGIPDADQEAFYQAFKKQKVTSVWSGNKIWEALQATRKDFLFNEHEALNILDKKFAEHGGSTGYLDKMLKWEQSTPGKKVLGELPPGVTAKSATGKIASKIEDLGLKKAKTEPVTMPGPTSTAPTVTHDVPQSVKTAMLQKLNSYGPMLSKPPSQVYQKIISIKDLAKSKGHELSDLEVLRILDAEKAAQLGVTNSNLYEKVVLEWLKTPSGKATAKKYAGGGIKKIASVKPSIPKATATSPVSTVGKPVDIGDISLAELRSKISTTDTHFADISVGDALTLQRQMTMQSGEWTASQRASLRYYTSNNYTKMNGYLRGQTSTTTPALNRHIAQAQAGMRPSTKPITVYRGTSFSQFGGTYVDESIVGKTFEDKGFMSTSVGGRAAFGGSVLLQIECPTGTPMAFVQSISHYSDENEMLLAAGTRYKVMSVTKEDGQTVVRVRVTP